MKRARKAKGPLVIAVTGGIGSGKSTVVAAMAGFGGRVIDCDRISREVVEPGKAAWRKIVAAFGREVVGPDGALERRKLGRMVFNDAGKRAVLEGITHPAIVREMKRRMAEFRREGDGSRPIVLDVPLLFEGGLEKLADVTVVVWVPRGVQAERLRARGGLTPGEIRARIRSQMPLSEKRKRADHVIDNTAPRGTVKAQVRKLWKVLTNDAE